MVRRIVLEFLTKFISEKSRKKSVFIFFTEKCISSSIESSALVPG
jgi:hypothetical protein